MMKKKTLMLLGTALLFVIGLMGCASMKEMKMTSRSVNPGTEVTFKGTPHKLLGDALRVGETLPSVTLTDAKTMMDVDLSAERGSVLLLSTVLSIDTAV
jgi:hypothetical protein